MGRLLATVSLAALAIAGALPEAMAYLKAGPNMAGPGHHRLKSPGGGALDGFVQPTAAYSFRKLISAYGGPAVKLRRASDTLTQDIGFLGFVPGSGSPIDAAAANAFCAATTCGVHTAFDQSGNGRDIVQAGAGSQPAANLSCILGGPCLRTTAATQNIVGPTFTPTSVPQSLSVVARRTTAGGACILLRENGPNRIEGGAAANVWALGAAAFTAPATDNVFHSAIGILSPTAGQSVLRIDAAETTGTATVSVVAATTGIVGAAATTCDHAEIVFWGDYALSPAERTVWHANQKAYWGTP